MALTPEQIAEYRQQYSIGTPKVAPQSSSKLGAIKDFGTGIIKGTAEDAIGTSRLLQTVGKGVAEAVTLGKADTSKLGFKSLEGEEARQIDELLKSENTVEKAGKLTVFLGGLMTPSGSRKAAGTVVNKGVDIAAGVVDDIAPKIEGVVEVAGNVASGFKSVGGMLVDSASRIPSRIATNVVEKQATREAVQALPTKLAQNAANEGIDIADIQELSKIDKTFKEPAKKLLNIVQKFARGETKTNPIEVVGQPIVNRIKQLESARGKVGQKLGEVANKLGVVAQEELITPVFNKLKSVSGLNGLKLKNNALDFSDTVLASDLSKADRSSIQKIFDEAVKWGNGKRKHLLRQELFEVLGGKKRSLSNITDTQEKAFEAIRSGLSDVLESKNGLYKSLSNDYRKIVQPLGDIRKFMKNTAGATEDILDMQAGLLARRLTSNAASNPQIRGLLKALDSATSVKGKAQLSVEKLQDFYNILDRYYDIAGKTGFQGQVKAGVEKAGGIKDAVLGTIKEFAGSTQATRTKALEELLTDLLGK
jgi:hypothetical protein